MPFGVPHQAINVHKRQQPGIQLERLGFAAFPRMTNANLERVIQRDRPISENVIHGVLADRILTAIDIAAIQRQPGEVYAVDINILPHIHIVNADAKRQRQDVAALSGLIA